MKKIKNFNEFVKESISFNSSSDFFNSLGSVITGKKNTVEQPNISYDNTESTDKTLVPLKNKDPRNILIVGDSHSSIKDKNGKAVTYTFPNILKKELEPQGYTIEVLALGGMTTQWMLENLPEKLRNKKYDRVYIYGGANDAMNSSITLEKALANIQKMVDLSRSNGADVFVNQGYIIEEEKGKFGNWRNMSIKGTVLKNQEEWIPYIERKKELQRRIPLEIKNSNFISPYDLKGLTSDGIHANSEGQKIVAQIFSNSIKNTPVSYYSGENSYSVPSGPLPNTIVIGDSIVPYVAKAAGIPEGPKAKSATVGGGGLWFGGIWVGTLLKFAKEYKNIDPSVKNVVISIGTNGIFSRSTKIIKDLLSRLKVIFPNAKVLVVKGAYGSKLTAYPALQRVSQSTVDDFYSDFSDNGAIVMPTPVGNVIDCHGHLPIYKTIAKEIQKNLKR
jgi:lysophospholipase L1-like esterase